MSRTRPLTTTNQMMHLFFCLITSDQDAKLILVQSKQPQSVRALACLKAEWLKYDQLTELINQSNTL